MATANNDSSKRGAAISELAPYAASLRAGLDIADTAAVPVAVLEGYVRVVDRLRPALRPKLDKDFEPIQYVRPSRS
jgi:hypothetical protein